MSKYLSIEIKSEYAIPIDRFKYPSIQMNFVTGPAPQRLLPPRYPQDQSIDAWIAEYTSARSL